MTAPNPIKRWAATRRRRAVLYAGASLVLTYVRNFLQYDRYGWDSAIEFLGTWFIHFVGLALLGAVFSALLKRARSYFLDEGINDDITEALVYTCLLAIIACVAIFIIAHWPISSEDFD